MVITIDGSAGSGKSTAARGLAARLGLPYLDTGAMYRALTAAAIQAGTSLDDQDALAEVTQSIPMAVTCETDATRITLAGEDVTDQLRTLEVSQAVSRIASVPAVRSRLIDMQREIGRQLGDLVTEGRDQGSVVFPEADVKFLIVADAEARARRRYEELCNEGRGNAGEGNEVEGVSFSEVLKNVQDRDAIDARQWAPLLASGVAVHVDTTGLSVEEVIDTLVTHVRRITHTAGA